MARPRPPLTVARVLAWADAHHARTGQWPRQRSGAVPEAPGLSWHAIDTDLAWGLRGLPGNDTLARLLARERGVQNRAGAPDLGEEQVLAWAEAHWRRTGRGPGTRSGPVADG